MFKNIKESFKNLNVLELSILLISEIIIILTFILSSERSILSLISSMLGGLSLIFLAKGDYIGHIISIIFSIVYIIISYMCKYYGEIFIYVFLMIPLSITSIITWKKNQIKNHQVKISKIKKIDIIIIIIVTLIIGFIFYFILKYLKTTNLLISTISVMTSFSASLLSIKRSPYYAIMYILNDLVLIIMWSLIVKTNISYLPNVICFITFLINDIYALINWKKIAKEQNMQIGNY